MRHPRVPEGLKAQIDSLGVVHLSWAPNTDSDIYGYRLYRAQTQGEEMIPITDVAIRGISYTDSVNLNSLNSRIYYAITALDQRYNQSRISKEIEVLKPNTIPPVAPLITEGIAQEGANLIKWTTTTDDPYLAGFVVMRQEEGGRQLRQIAKLDRSSATDYKDRDLLPGHTYTYQVSAYSSGGLSSPLSPPFRVRSLQGSQGQDPSLSLEILPEGIAIKWSIPFKDVVSVSLYKLDSSQAKFVYRENLPASGELIDQEINQRKENKYILQVKAKGRRPITIQRSIRL